MATRNPKKYASLKGLTDDTLIQVMRHYIDWTMENNIRRTRPNGWDAVTDAYFGKLPVDWPYNSRVVDPRIRTTVIEKDARLINAKLRGRLVPREGGDVLKARINNAILDFQWDSANEGGTMLSKWHGISQDSRLYGSDFGLTKWRYETDDDGDVSFNGNDFVKLDVRNVGLDPNCDNVRNAHWVQVREWATIDEMQEQNDTPDGKAKMYPGLDELIGKISYSVGNKRQTDYPNRILNLKGIEDKLGNDRSFPVCEIVTEYRTDRWVTFAPKYMVTLRDIPNPYEHGKIPVVQLRYYKITGDAWGESEVEPVLPIWKAIQANLCGYLDTMNIHMRPPLKIIGTQVRIETIVFGPEAQWDVDSPNAVTEFEGSSEPMNLFQTTHSALVSSFNTAMGDLSQGQSAVDPFNPHKTATEIDQSVKQQNSRDQMNQLGLAEALEDMMSMWLSNNQQFLFADPGMKEYIIRIVGSDLYAYFQKAGLDQMQVAPEVMQMIGDTIGQQGGNVSDGDIQQLLTAGATPKYPVFTNPNEKNPAKLQFKPKMAINDTGDGAEISVVPEDLDGSYDYIADTKSMASGAGSEQQAALQKAVDSLTTNPAVIQLLQQEGVSPKIKELLIAQYQGLGLMDAEQYFTQNDQQPAQTGAPGQPQQGNPLAQAFPNAGVPGGATSSPQAVNPGAMAQPQQLPQQGGVPTGV